MIAELDDYAVVRELVSDLIGDVAGSSVSTSIRDTVHAVDELLAHRGDDASANTGEIAKKLERDRSAASRQIRAARKAGCLKNLQDRRGKAAQIVLGEPLPDEQELLPQPGQLDTEFREDDEHTHEAGDDHHDREGQRQLGQERRLELEAVDGVELWMLEGPGSDRQWQLRRDDEVLAETEIEDFATAQGWIEGLRAGRVPAEAVGQPPSSQERAPLQEVLL